MAAQMGGRSGGKRCRSRSAPARAREGAVLRVHSAHSSSSASAPPPLQARWRWPAAWAAGLGRFTVVSRDVRPFMFSVGMAGVERVDLQACARCVWAPWGGAWAGGVGSSPQTGGCGSASARLSLGPGDDQGAGPRVGQRWECIGVSAAETAGAPRILHGGACGTAARAT